MPSKLQSHFYDIAATHKGMISAKDTDNLVEGEYSFNVNMLVRNGELRPIKGETYMDYEWTTQPVKMFTYQTDRDANGDLNTIQWLVWNDTAGKIYRGVLAASLTAVTEILDPDGNSFNIVVKQFLVVHQDLLFHQGHSGEAFIYGYREILRHPIFSSTIGWTVDRIATNNPAYLAYDPFQSGYAYSDGSDDFLISSSGGVLRKHNLNADGSLGTIVWENNLKNAQGNIVVGTFTWESRIKIMGVDTGTDEVWIMLQRSELATSIVSPLWMPFHLNVTRTFWVFNTDNGKLERELEITGATSWAINDAVLRYDAVNSVFRIYAVGATFSGGALLSNYIMIINPVNGSLWKDEAFTFSGTNVAGAPAVSIDVGFNTTNTTMVIGITGWADDYANDPSTFEVWSHDGDLALTYRSNDTTATPSQWWTNGGLTCVEEEQYGSEIRFTLFRSDIAGASKDMAHYEVDDAYALTGSSLTTVTFHEKFVQAVSATHFDQTTAAEFMVGKVSNDGSVDLAWVDENAAVQKVITQLFQLLITAGATVSTETTKARYRVALKYDKEYSVLSPMAWQYSGAVTTFIITVMVNKSIGWDRVNQLSIFRAIWDADLNAYGEYLLMVELPLTGDVTKVTNNGEDWDTYSPASSKYATVAVTDGLEILVDSFESLSGFPEDVETLNTRYGSAVYANNRLYAGNIWLNNEVLNDRISWSSLNGLAIPPSNYLTLTKGDPDQITALQFHEDWLLIGKQNALFIYDVTSYEPAEWFEVRLINGVGIIDNDAIAATPHGIFFYGNTAVYRLDRQQGIKDISTGIVSDTYFAQIDDSKVYYDIYNKTVLFNTSTYSHMYDLITGAWSMFYSITAGGDYIYQKLTVVDATNGKMYMCGYDSGLTKYRLYELFSSASNIFDITFAPFGKKNSILRFREMWLDSEETINNADVDAQIMVRLPNTTSYSAVNAIPITDEYIPIMKEGSTARFRIHTNEAKTTITNIAIRGIEWMFMPTRKRVRNLF